MERLDTNDWDTDDRLQAYFDGELSAPEMEELDQRVAEEEDLAARLEGLEEGRWQGPVPSGRGLHFVWIEARRANPE